MAVKNLISIWSPYEIAGMRAAGKAAGALLRTIGEAIRPGISTAELDAIAVAEAGKGGFRNAPLGYLGGGVKPFPRSICTSVNEVVCHGIPGPRLLKAGDLVNVDVTPVVDGWHGDCSATFLVGEVSDEDRKLVETTKACLDAGVAAAGPGRNLKDVAGAIEDLAVGAGFSVVRELTGHGLGRLFHTAPMVYHCRELAWDLELRAGMIFTIEPMINLGAKAVKTLADGWTVVTVDGKKSAQFEHTVLITEDGVERLTI